MTSHYAVQVRNNHTGGEASRYSTLVVNDRTGDSAGALVPHTVAVIDDGEPPRCAACRRLGPCPAVCVIPDDEDVPRCIQCWAPLDDESMRPSDTVERQRHCGHLFRVPFESSIGTCFYCGLKRDVHAWSS